MSGFFQSTTAHCEADALAHIKRDNPHAPSITLVGEHAMGFGNITQYRFEVEMVPARPVTPWEDDTPMFFSTPTHFLTVPPVRSKTAHGWS